MGAPHCGAPFPERLFDVLYEYTINYTYHSSSQSPSITNYTYLSKLAVSIHTVNQHSLIAHCHPVRFCR